MEKNNTSNTLLNVNVEKIFKFDEKLRLSDYMATRMTKCASMLSYGDFLGWQMIVPKKGRVNITAFASDSLSKNDLKWICEKTGKINGRTTNARPDNTLSEVYELYLPVAETGSQTASIGFGESYKAKTEVASRWPYNFSSQFTELIKSLQETGAVFRVLLGPANDDEQENCRRSTLKTYNISNINVNDYIGTPVKIRVLLQLPSAPTVRLKTVLAESVQGSKLRYLGNVSSEIAKKLLENPLQDAGILPDYAARFLVMQPIISETIVGVDVCEEETKPIPVTHKNSKSNEVIEIGSALDVASGKMRKINVSTTDLRRHYQIIGQTGTGKSTLLASMILNAAKQGMGLTFFDPHGTTIDAVLRSLPKEYVQKFRVVRIGDTEHPVPLNIWDSDDPAKEERNISDLCELFSDIFDPKREGFVGPRYERWLSTFAKASIAFLGKRASLESIAVISQSQDNMLKLSRAIVKKYPELVETIKEEYGTDKSSDFHNMLNWYLCKFQRLTSVEQLRKTLGAGANALDFNHYIDTDTITLIDLASPTIGTHAARIIGTLLMMKLWNAAMSRKERDRTHMVIVDEASLFQTNPMPRMLSESRKFGLAMVLSHQHTGQLTSEIRDALESNSANLTAFRLSTTDAVNAAIRFDNPDMQISLTRLPAFQGITSISVDGMQTAPFTLKIAKPKVQKDGEQIKEFVEKRSIETLVKPYEHLRALTYAEIRNMLDEWTPPKQEDTPPVDLLKEEPPSIAPPPVDNLNGDTSKDMPEWLDKWNKRKVV